MAFDVEEWRGRYDRAFDGLSPRDAIARTREIIGAPIPKSEDVAAAAMTKLLAGTIPSAQELMALEFFIRVMRLAGS